MNEHINGSLFHVSSSSVEIERFISLLLLQVKTDVSKDEEEEKIGEYKIKKRKNEKIEEEQK